MVDQLFQALIGDIVQSDVREVAIFPHSVYIDSIHVGLASPVNAEPCLSVRNAGQLHKMNTRELAEMIFSKNLLEAAIGLAAINASLRLDKERFTTLNALEVLNAHITNRNISIIGHFPFVEKLKQAGKHKNLWVFELQPKHDEDLSSDLLPKFLPVSDIVLISATTLINHTFEVIHKHIQHSFNIMLGPSTPLSPKLFDFGIDVICGAIVTNREKARVYLAQGARYRDAKGLKFVTLTASEPESTTQPGQAGKTG